MTMDRRARRSAHWTLAILVGVWSFSNGVASQDICSTSACAQAASVIINNMDASANPCDDFYQFTCGNYTKNAVIPEDKSLVAFYSSMRDKVRDQLRTSIEEQIRDDDPKSFKLLRSYYETCLSEDQGEKNSETEFLEVLDEYGGWPVLSRRTSSSFDWKDTVYMLRETGYPFTVFINLEIQNDLKNNSRKRVYIDQPSFGIAQEYLSQGLKSDIVKAYYKYMTEFAVLLGATRIHAQQQLRKSLDFEINLAKISFSSSERRNNPPKFYNPMTISDLQSTYPTIPWLDYINRILSPHQTLHSTDTVIVPAPSYLKNLEPLLAKTPKRVLANYALWRVVQASAELMGTADEQVRELRREFKSKLTGGGKSSPRWVECLNEASVRLRHAAGALYVRRHFSKEAKARGVEMTRGVQESFRNMLVEINWLDEKTKASALEKLAHMQPLVAYPDEYFIDETLDRYYENFEVQPDSLLRTRLNFNLLQLNRKINQLDRPVTKGYWADHPGAAVVNAYYNEMENSIIFTAGSMQGAYFDTGNPNYMNYAGFGFLVGHEITHGFDDQGRQFDKDGNLLDWWAPTTEAEYLRRAQCIVDQYSNYTVKDVGIKLQGWSTQGENIADNGGMEAAYLAYEDWEKRNGVEPRLPGLEAYSVRQMFWISFGNVWCAKYRPEYLRDLILTDPHTPNEFRVIGSLTNLPEFSRDFGCPVGAGMNPAVKCKVW